MSQLASHLQSSTGFQLKVLLLKLPLLCLLSQSELMCGLRIAQSQISCRQMVSGCLPGYDLNTSPVSANEEEQQVDMWSVPAASGKAYVQTFAKFPGKLLHI